MNVWKGWPFFFKRESLLNFFFKHVFVESFCFNFNKFLVNVSLCERVFVSEGVLLLIVMSSVFF